MAVRGTMTALNARVRQLIGDTAGPAQDFDDQAVQDVLDAHRADVRYELLRPAPDIQPPQGQGTTAQFAWVNYFSEFQHWEDDYVLQGMTTNNGATISPWVVLTPLTAEPIVGRFAFGVTLPAIATPPVQFPPIYATGKVYDIYAAAAELLERRIALRSFTTFDVTSDGKTLRLGQILDRWEKLAASYWARAWARSIELERSDLAIDSSSGGVPMLSDGQGGMLPGVLGADVTATGGY